jgi:hypothetical protein
MAIRPQLGVGQEESEPPAGEIWAEQSRICGSSGKTGGGGEAARALGSPYKITST